MSACLSATPVIALKRLKRLKMVFGIEASYTVLQGKLGIAKRKGTFPWNCVTNSGLETLTWQINHRKLSQFDDIHLMQQ